MTDAHVEAVRRWSEQSGVALSTLDVVGFHGQTITHRPERHFTWQIGDGAAPGARYRRESGERPARRRRQGGRAGRAVGAGLSRRPRARSAEAAGRGECRRRRQRDLDRRRWFALLAFDTGPGNAPIDDWCARRAGLRFDTDGALAASGKVDRARVERFSEHRYFAIKPPKSLDRGDFNDSWADGLSVVDGAATLTRGTARAHCAGGAPLPGAGDAMGDRRRRRAQSDAC